MAGNNAFYDGRLGLSAGTIRLGGPFALTSFTTVWLPEPGTTLDLNNFNLSFHNWMTMDVRANIVLGSGNLIFNSGMDVPFNITGDISGTGGLFLNGNGRIGLTGAARYSGPTQVNAGTLVVGTLLASPSITVGAGGRLSGRGQVHDVTVFGTLNPGHPPEEPGRGTGILSSDGRVSFQPGSQFAGRLQGPEPGTGYDQLNVRGPVDLNGASLRFTVDSGVAENATFTILHSSAGLTGTFDGLPDGASFTIGYTPFKINYTANDVVLTRQKQFLDPVFTTAGYARPDSGLAVGDFNGDRIPDLAMVNGYDDTVSILLGNGDGTFQTGGTISLPLNPGVVVAGHFHDPNIFDLAISGYTAGVGSVYILLGNGDGTFQAPVSYPTGSGQPASLAVGNLNPGGRADLVVANPYSHNISILYGNGDGTFQAPVIMDFPNYFPSAVAVADLGNGRPDIVVGNTAGLDYYSVISVLVNIGYDDMGHAVFRHETTDDYAVQREIASLAVGDFNGDGRPDVLLTTSRYESVGVLLGNGDGTLAQRLPIFSPAGGKAGAVAVNDFDGDGRLDVAVTAANQLSVLYGNGDGSFGPPNYYDPVPFGFPVAVVTDDFNGDGAPDLAVLNFVSGPPNQVAVLLNAVSRGGGRAAPPPGKARPGRRAPAVAPFPDARLLVLEKASGAGWAAPSPVSQTAAEATPSPRTLAPASAVSRVDQFFAFLGEEKRGPAVSRWRPRTVPSLDDVPAREPGREIWLAGESLLGEVQG